MRTYLIHINVNIDGELTEKIITDMVNSATIAIFENVDERFTKVKVCCPLWEEVD